MTDKEIQEAYAEMELIGREILTEWRQRGQANYRDAFVELGARGQFSDIWRKIQKLKHAVWEGRPLVGEQAEQIAAEIIPHCLMLIWLLRHEVGEIREALPGGPFAPIEMIEINDKVPAHEVEIVRNLLKAGMIRVVVRR